MQLAGARGGWSSGGGVTGGSCHSGVASPTASPASSLAAWHSDHSAEILMLRGAARLCPTGQSVASGHPIKSVSVAHSRIC